MKKIGKEIIKKTCISIGKRQSNDFSAILFYQVPLPKELQKKENQN